MHTKNLRIIKQLKFIFGLSALTFVLNSCNTTFYREIQLEDGQKFSAANSAELRVYKDATRLHSIDNKEVEFTRDDFNEALKVRLAPGLHSVMISYYGLHIKSSSLGQRMHFKSSKNVQSLSFNAVAGSVYLIHTPLVNIDDD